MVVTMFFQRNTEMCEVCDFYEKLSLARKSDVALDSSGRRTVYGYYDAGDAAVLAQHYPRAGLSTIEMIANLINHPRLLEVAGAVEMVERYLEGSFSKLRGVAINIASNPLSILFWSKSDNAVHRVKTRETELLHGPMEKLALRSGSVLALNTDLGRTHGIALTFGCSCCVIAVAERDLKALYASEYYQEREGLGRFFDSDVLTTSGTLFEGVSVADVPPAILSASADFGELEVRSYLRFARAAQAVIEEHPVTPHFARERIRAQRFLAGSESVQASVSVAA